MRRGAAGHHRGAFTARDVDVTLDPVQLFFRNLRTHLCRLVRRIADDDLARLLAQLADELFFHGFLDKQSRTGATDLALVAEDSQDRASDGLIEIGISKHDVRRFAAELQRNLCEILSRGLRDQFADLSRTSERDLVDAWMRSECSAGS